MEQVKRIYVEKKSGFDIEYRKRNIDNIDKILTE